MSEEGQNTKNRENDKTVKEGNHGAERSKTPNDSPFSLKWVLVAVVTICVILIVVVIVLVMLYRRRVPHVVAKNVAVHGDPMQGTEV